MEGIGVLVVIGVLVYLAYSVGLKKDPPEKKGNSGGASDGTSTDKE